MAGKIPAIFYFVYNQRDSLFIIQSAHLILMLLQ